MKWNETKQNPKSRTKPEWEKESSQLVKQLIVIVCINEWPIFCKFIFVLSCIFLFFFFSFSVQFCGFFVLWFLYFYSTSEKWLIVVLLGFFFVFICHFDKWKPFRLFSGNFVCCMEVEINKITFSALCHQFCWKAILYYLVSPPQKHERKKNNTRLKQNNEQERKMKKKKNPKTWKPDPCIFTNSIHIQMFSFELFTVCLHSRNCVRIAIFTRECI